MEERVRVHKVQLGGDEFRVIRPEPSSARLALRDDHHWLSMYVDRAGAQRLVALWALAARSARSLIHLPIRANRAPEGVDHVGGAVGDGEPVTLDLVLLHHLACRAGCPVLQGRGECPFPSGGAGESRIAVRVIRRLGGRRWWGWPGAVRGGGLRVRRSGGVLEGEGVLVTRRGDVGRRRGREGNGVSRFVACHVSGCIRRARRPSGCSRTARTLGTCEILRSSSMRTGGGGAGVRPVSRSSAVSSPRPGGRTSGWVRATRMCSSRP